MPLPHDRNFVPIESGFKKRDSVVCKKLRRDGPWDTIAVSLFSFAECYILNSLNRSKNIRSALCLNGHDVLCTPAIEPNVKLIYLDLPIIKNSSA
jgi:hypothetical protein